MSINIQFAICQWGLELADKAVQELRDNGVTAIETGPPFVLECDEATVRETGKRYRAAGIALYSCHAPFGGENDLSLLEEEARVRAVEMHVRTLQRAALAGISCVVIHPSGRIEDDEEPRQRRDQLHRSLETLVGAAQEAGVRLALENMLPQHVGSESAEVRRIVDAYDSPALGVCFDIGHAHLNEEGVEAAFANLRDRIITFHLQDNSSNRDDHLQPPYGTIDWERFAGDFRTLDFPHPVAVEARPWNGAAWGVLLREMESLFSEGRLMVDLGNTRVKVMCQECGRYCFGTPQNWSCGCR
jgi:sugar phosphate isomerase/epimerase